MPESVAQQTLPKELRHLCAKLAGQNVARPIPHVQSSHTRTMDSAQIFTSLEGYLIRERGNTARWLKHERRLMVRQGGMKRAGGGGWWSHPVVLLGAHDLDVRVGEGLPPVGKVAHYPRHCEQHREEVRREAQRPVNQPCEARGRRSPTHPLRRPHQPAWAAGSYTRPAPHGGFQQYQLGEAVSGAAATSTWPPPGLVRGWSYTAHRGEHTRRLGPAALRLRTTLGE